VSLFCAQLLAQSHIYCFSLFECVSDSNAVIKGEESSEDPVLVKTETNSDVESIETEVRGHT
jgi:hypothetical protein